MAQVESSGVAKAGLATGIVGTSLAGLLALGAGGGLLGRLTGNNDTATAAALAGQGAYQAALSAKDAEIGQLRAERYADQVAASTYDRAAQLSNRNDEKITANLKEAYQELVVTRERLATADANFKCLAESVAGLQGNVADLNREVADMRVREQRTADMIECTKKEFGAAIALESERRVAGQNNLMAYVNATFVPGQLVMPQSAICPPVMPRFNSWTAPTDTTTTTTTTADA